MAKFLTPLICEKIEGTNDTWLLHEDLQYQSDIAGLIIVPKGFTTDFASVPRFAWILFPKDGKYDGAAVVHDYLYSIKTLPRELCDKVFLEAMTVLGVPWITRHLMYRAVRMFGGLYWSKLK